MLTHTQQSLLPKQTLVDYEPLDIIPDGPGKPTRLGRVALFVWFVVNVVLKAKNGNILIDLTTD